MLRNLGVLALFVLLPLAVGFASGMSTVEGVRTWYQEIAKPAWTPPDGVFGPVWTALYISMGIAAYLAWRRGPAGPSRRRALTLFVLQLVLNGLWSVLFFGLRSPGLAFAEILVLLALIALTVRAFYARARPAGWLMTPYLAWVAFAAVLNFTIWRMNP